MDNSNKEEKPDFKNQGEQEDYWAKQLFKEHYQFHNYEKFKGHITINGSAYNFDSQELSVVNTAKYLKLVFENGILYPQIIKGGGLTISGLEEVKFLNVSDTQKRFRFWLFRKDFANPTVYFIELTNDTANSKTEIGKFIDGAKLTFVKEGWVII